MSSTSLLDYFADKIHSYSTKMRGDSLLHYNTSFLLPANSTPQHDPVRILNDLREYGILENPHRTMIINQVLEELGAYQSLRHLHNMGRNEIFSSINTNTIFSPHFLNLMNALNSFCFKSLFDKPFVPYSSSITGNMNSYFSRTHPIDLVTDSDLKKNCNLPVISEDSKMSPSDTGACSSLPAALKQIDTNGKKCNMSASLKLNLKLANRKTKQMNRRSRNRRRRQKKGMHVHASSASSLSDDGDYKNDCDSNVKCPVSGSVSFVAESQSFECTVSFQHNVQIPSLVSSFVVPVESDSEDDSDWESYDEEDCVSENNCEVSSMHGVSSSESCSSTSDSSDYSVSDDEVKSCGFSFVVPVGSSSEEDDDEDDWSDNDEDDDDWDTCNTSDLPDVTEFEFTGLFVTNLCSFRKVPAVVDCEPETAECLQIRKEVLDANKKWNELKDVEKNSASKVNKL